FPFLSPGRSSRKPGRAYPFARATFRSCTATDRANTRGRRQEGIRSPISEPLSTALISPDWRRKEAVQKVPSRPAGDFLLYHCLFGAPRRLCCPEAVAPLMESAALD